MHNNNREIHEGDAGICLAYRSRRSLPRPSLQRANSSSFFPRAEKVTIESPRSRYTKSSEVVQEDAIVSYDEFIRISSRLVENDRGSHVSYSSRVSRFICLQKEGRYNRVRFVFHLLAFDHVINVSRHKCLKREERVGIFTGERHSGVTDYNLLEIRRQMCEDTKEKGKVNKEISKGKESRDVCKWGEKTEKNRIVSKN